MIARTYNLRTFREIGVTPSYMARCEIGHSENRETVVLSGNGQALQHEAAETGAGTTTDGVVDHESLQTSAVVGQLTDAVQAQVDDLLTNGVVTASKVVGGVLLT